MRRTHCSQILHAADVVEDREIGDVVEQRVDREVAAEGVLDRGSEAVVAGDQQLRRGVGGIVRGDGGARNGEPGLAAEGRDLHHHVAEEDVHQAEAAPDDPGVAEDPADLLRLGVGRDVEVLRLASEEQVADAAADHVGEIAGLLQTIEDLQRLFLDPAAGDRMLGTGERCAVGSNRSLR